MSKTFDNIEDLEKSIEEYRKNRSLYEKIESFFRKKFGEIESFFQEIKYAYQRVVRKYDDRAAWGVSFFLAEVMPPILTQVKERRRGVPVAFLPENKIEYTNEEIEEGIEKFGVVVDKIIFAFQVSQIMDDMPFSKEGRDEYIKKMEELVAIRNEGMDLFKEHIDDLWE